MATQTALALTEIGKPLSRIILPVPDKSSLKEHEVLIKVTVAGLAPFDQKLRDKGLHDIGSKLPAVISGDLVGVVVHNGPNIAFPIGAHVFSQTIFQYPRDGGLQEYAIVNGLYTAIVPAGISDLEAALYPINAVTSAVALFTSAGLGLPFPGTLESKSFDYAAQNLVIVGGGSNKGKLAIQFARLAGIGTIVAVASPSGVTEIKNLGATHIVDRHAVDVEEQVRKIVGDELQYVYDTSSFGDHSLPVSLLSNTKKGTLAHLLPGIPNEDVLVKKIDGFVDKQVFGFSSAIPEFGQLFWNVFPKWLESGKVKPQKYHVIDGLNSEKVNSVLDMYRDGKGKERYHVRISQQSIR